MNIILGVLKVFRQPVVLFILLIISAAGGGYLYFQSQEELKRLRENPQVLSQGETKKLIDEVGKALDLPKGEDPVVATVVDASKLKGQPFFVKAQNGDKVLIYTQARRAILYRPDSNKIIDVAPVNIGTASAQTGVAGAQNQNVRVALYNGTTTAGLTNTAGSRLESELDNIEIVTRANASRDDYEGTTVVDLSGGQKVLVDRIAKLLDGRIGSLPSGESKPNADILIILGSTESTEEPTTTPSPTTAP